MIGISGPGKEAIGQAVEEIFDQIALQLVGGIPRLKNKKLAVISSKPNLGLGHLFVQAMRNRTPNEIERDALKSMLESSYGYVEALKNKTKSNVVESIDGLVKQAKLRGVSVTQEDFQQVLSDEMRKARTHMAAIVESESTKLRNVGSMMDISRVASDLGDNDPTVFFVVVRDGRTCKECLRLHTVDGTIPRLWKFSQLKQGYHKRGEDNPSAFGLHPHCRCTLTYLSRGFGFDSGGKLKYVAENYDAFLNQK